MLGDKLKKLRERKGLNKKQMAQELGLQYMTYCRYENDEREPNNEILIEIANYFDVTIDYLIGNSLKLDIYPHEYETAEIRCPVCGCENVHFVRIANVEFESEKSNGGAIEFRCEDGHLFYYVFETLKGCSYIVNFGKDAVTTCQTSNLPYDSGISSLKEIELSELYNSLDNYGKEAVESILRIEYNRCNAGNQNTSLLVGRRPAVVVLVRDDECRLLHASKPPCRRLHHHDVAQGHLHAPPPERLPYLVAQLPAVDEEQHQLAVFRGTSGDLCHNDRFSAAAGKHNAGCLVSRPPGMACLLYQILLIRPQYAHGHSSPFLIVAALTEGFSPHS